MWINNIMYNNRYFKTYRKMATAKEKKGVERGAPKQMEWRAAFGLMVTLIWLYIEVLELLAKIAIASRR